MVNGFRDLKDELFQLIEDEKYFTIQSGRQSGKTTLLFDLLNHIKKSGDYYAFYCSLENIQTQPDEEKGIPAILSFIKSNVKII
jgi:predicted AAA+ superfamily ATPase